MKVEATPEQDAMVQAFARAIEAAGGKALLVGGLVRDEILGLPSKDFDFEVFGLPMEKINEILSRFGNVKEVGQQFGVLNIQELDWDVAMPRREVKTGEGHKGFDVVPDPTMSIEDAARRRDLTINALSKDPLTGEIIDPLNGMADIKAGILRMADPHTFGDDPLRALRVAQFAARFDFEVDPETLKVVAAQPLEQLPGERILPEFSKMLLKGKTPSKGIEVLRQANLLRYFPEIEALQGVPQEPKWHPEGDVYIHTMMVLDEAGKQRTGDPDFDLPLMFGALAHDFGKPMNTEEIDGKITSRGHEEAGVAPTNAFMSRMKAPLALTKQVETLVSFHLRPAILPNTGGGRKGYRKLGRELEAGGVSPDLLTAMSKADVLGRTTDAALRRDVSSQDKFLEEYHKHVTSQATGPGGKLVDSVSGKHLIAKGFKPGKDMGKFLALTRSIEDETGITDPDKLIELATRFLSDRPEGGGSQEGNENDCGDSHIREGEECFDGDYREQRKKGNTKSTFTADLDWTVGRPCGDDESYPEKCTGPGSSAESPYGAQRDISFQKPDFENEYEEALRYPHLSNMTPEEWGQLAETGQAVKWSDIGEDIGNHDTPEEFDTLDEDKRARFQESFQSGNFEMPIVIRTPDGKLDLLGGNTRQAGLRGQGVDPTVWVVDTARKENAMSTASWMDWTVGRPCEDGPEQYPEKCTGPGSSAENPSGPHDETGLEEIRRQAEEQVKRKKVPPNPKQSAADKIMLKRAQEQKKAANKLAKDTERQNAADQKMLTKEEKAAEMVRRKQDAADEKMLLKEQKSADKRDQGADRAGQDLEKVGDKAFKDARSLQDREAAKKAKDLERRAKMQDREAQKKQKEWMKNESPQALQLQKEKQDAADQKMLTKEENKVAKEALKQQKLVEKAKNDAAKQAAKLSKEQAAGLKKAEQEYEKFLAETPKSQVPQGFDFAKFLEYILLGPDEEKASGSAKGPSGFRTNPDKTQPDYLLWEKYEWPADKKGESQHPGLATAEPQRLHHRTVEFPGVKDFDRGSRFSVHPLEGPLGRDGFGGSTPSQMEELKTRPNGMTPETGVFPDWDIPSTGDIGPDHRQPFPGSEEFPKSEYPNDKGAGFLATELPIPQLLEDPLPHPSPTRGAEDSPPSSFPGQIVRKPGGGGLDRAPMIKPRGADQETGFLPVQNLPDPERNMFKSEIDPTDVQGPGGNDPGGSLTDRGRSGRGGGTKRRDYWDMDFTGKKSGFMSIGPPKENIYPAATEAARTMEDLMDIDAIFPKEYSPSLEEERPGIGPSMNHRNERHVAPDPIQSDDDANVEQKQVQPLIPNQKMAIAVDPKGPMGERIVIMSPLFEEVSPAIMALRSHRFERHGGIVIDGPPEWLLGITPRLEALDKSSGNDGAADLFSRVQQLIQSAGMPIEYEQQPRP